MAGMTRTARFLGHVAAWLGPAGLVAWLVFTGPALAGEPAVGPDVVQAVNRLTYGPTPGLLEKAAAMGAPAFIDEQLAPEALPEPPDLERALAALPTLQKDTVRLFREYGPPAEEGRADGPEAMRRTFDRADAVALEAAKARLLRAVASPNQLLELMVAFWCDHLSLGPKKGLSHLWIGSYEREAIRPHALGSFFDLLAATAMHPAMLMAQDNWKNVVVREAGKPAKEAIDATYAAVLLSRQTLGPGGPQKPADVQALARILTGWRVGAARADSDTGGFYFDAERHDPSDKVLLGQRVAGMGFGEGAAALRLLAEHPATAKNISRKLAVYFLADDPPPALVARLADTFQKTGGDIRQTLRALCTSPEFQDDKYRGGRVKSPLRQVASALRALGAFPADAAGLVGTLAALGQPLPGDAAEGALAPAAQWAKAEALPRRVSFAGDLAAGRIAGLPTPTADAAALACALGPTLSPAARQAAERGGVAVILASPDFVKY